MNATDFETVQNMILQGGNFARYLGRAMQAADPDNLERVKAAFPDIIERYRPCEGIRVPQITASVMDRINDVARECGVDPYKATHCDFRRGPS